MCSSRRWRRPRRRMTRSRGHDCVSSAVDALFNPFAGDADRADRVTGDVDIGGGSATGLLDLGAEPPPAGRSGDQQPHHQRHAGSDRGTPRCRHRPDAAAGMVAASAVVGPLIVTPIVAFINQIPVVSDVLHPLIGYPVQPGLSAGAPLPRDVKVISFDGTQIYVHFMPALGLEEGRQRRPSSTVRLWRCPADEPEFVNGPLLPTRHRRRRRCDTRVQRRHLGPAR